MSANETVALYECDGKLDAKEHWYRRMVVNRFDENSNGQIVDESGKKLEAAPEKPQRSQRIKTFCWIPPPETHIGRPSLESRQTRKTFMLATCDDNADISVHVVQPPRDLLGPTRTSWQTSIVEQFSIIPDDTVSNQVLTCLPSTFTPPSAGNIDRLTWSPWVSDGTNTLTSTMAYTYDSILHIIAVNAELQDGKWKIVYHSAPERVDSSLVRSPLRWLPTPERVAQNTLIYFSSEGLNRLDVDCGPPPAIQKNLLCAQDMEWGNLTSLAFIKRKVEHTEICAALQLAELDRGVSMYDLGSELEFPAAAPSWVKSMLKARRAQGKTFGHANNICSHIHGLATSPLGDFSAPCISFHPKEGLEYVIPASQEAFITITRETEHAEDKLFFTDNTLLQKHAIAAEVILPTLARLKDREPPLDPNVIEAQVFACLGYQEAHNEAVATRFSAGSDLSALAMLFRQRLLYQTDFMKLRVKRLVDIALKKLELPSAPELAVLKRLVSLTIELKEALPDAGAVSGRTTKLHHIILRRLIAREQQVNGSASNNGPNEEEQNVESCEVCSAGVSFESLRWSRCDKGHQFARCGLSFLSIQSAGKSKSCCICGMQYLDEFKVDGLAKSTTPNGYAPTAAVDKNAMQGVEESKLSEPLLRVLFSACDICLYCGGKFTG